MKKADVDAKLAKVQTGVGRKVQQAGQGGPIAKPKREDVRISRRQISIGRRADLMR